MTNPDSLQIAELVRRLKSGETLTPAETAKLEAYRQAHALVDQAGAMAILQCSRQQLHAYRKAGLPHQRVKGRVLYSPDALHQWQAAHGYSGNLANTLTNPGSSAVKIAVDLTSTPLERLHQMERQAFADYQSAASIGERRGLLRIHSEVSKAISERERSDKFIAEQQIKWWSETEQALGKWCEPVKSYLNSAPKILAAQCNPADPAIAFNALTAWLETTLLPTMNRKPVAPTEKKS